ncbi:ABC transporter ATP-binding protein [Metamycoplasma equirhinis]|uniref:ABC transporter ATP-binding protein n=1 Tax=Metamycoplasma equirhinis TaxID=92402 RepID=UPI0035937692
MNSAILKINNLTKIYPKSDKGIKEISFEVPTGDFHSFIGENGAGKTTTIKTIIGLYTKYTGEILIDGISSKEESSKSIIGYVPEVANFPKELTTNAYLKYLALLSNIDSKIAQNRIDEMLKKFGIYDLKNKCPYSFSSGQKKKVLLIQALIHKPKLLILDEPSANLDPTARFELFTLLNELKKEGVTIFISSHILTEIDRYTDSLTLIHNGEILYNGKKYSNLENIFYDKVIKNN